MRQLLRKAGERLRQFDDAYTNKIDERIGSYLESIVKNRDLNTVETLGATGLGAVTRPVTRRYTEEDGEVPQFVQYGVPVASAAVKYGLPAAGIGLGAKGIYDVTQMLTQQTDGTMELI